jgi:hypothetical protein
MNPQLTREATVYQRRNRVIVNRVDTTIDGIPFSTDDIELFDRSVGDDVLGLALVNAINKARSGMKPLRSEEWQAALAPLLAAAGVGS